MKIKKLLLLLTTLRLIHGASALSAVNTACYSDKGIIDKEYIKCIFAEQDREINSNYIGLASSILAFTTNYKYNGLYNDRTKSKDKKKYYDVIYYEYYHDYKQDKKSINWAPIPVGILLPSLVASVSPDPLSSSSVALYPSSSASSSTIIGFPVGVSAYSGNQSSLTSKSYISSLPAVSAMPFASLPVVGFLDRHRPKLNDKLERNGYLYHEYNYNEKYHDKEYKAVVTFGDSLSDTGTFGRASVYMADGDVNTLYNNIFSFWLTGKPSVPDTQKGMNFARSGSVIHRQISIMDPTSFGRLSVTDQIDWYLKDYGANKDTIYTYWAGGNDLSSKLQSDLPLQAIKDIPKGFKNLLNPNGATSNGNKELIQYQTGHIKRLKEAGAGYIYFMNLPASGNAPFTQMLAEGALFGILDIILEKTPLIVISPDYWLAKHTDKFLRNPANHIGNPQRRAKEYIFENNVKALKDRYKFLPKQLLAFYYKTASELQDAYIRQFNKEGYNQLLASGVDGIIYADIDELFLEVMDRYKDFGIDEILVPQCELSLQSTSCNANSDRYHNDKIYAFTDWHHPSGYVHQMIAQYMLSFLEAPNQVKILSDMLDTNIDDINRWDELTHTNGSRLLYSYNMSQSRNIDKRHDNKLHELKVGYIKDIGSIKLGAGLTYSLQNARLKLMNYKYENIALTLMGDIHLTTSIHASLTGSYAIPMFNNAYRNIPLGKGIIKKEGNLKVKDIYSYEFNIYQTIPIYQDTIRWTLGWSTNNTPSINYKERHKQYYTSNVFDMNKADLKNNYGVIGLDYTTQFKAYDVRITGKYNKLFGNKYSVDVNNKELKYNKDYTKYNKLNANLSINFKGMLNGLYTSTGITRQMSNNKNDLHYTIGYSVKF